MAGQWNAPITAPFSVGLMLLLTDGSVLAQDAGTAFWSRLYPDRAGRYAQGEWRRTADSTNAPLYFASAVLKDGRVFVAGGEYSNNETKSSDLCTAEIHDPVAETWRSLTTPDGWSAIGDAPCCVLNDGRVLLGNIDAGPCAIWNPDTEAWAVTGAKANNSSNEETWTLLPDGSVLTVDCKGQVDGQGSASERFVEGAWIANGTTPASLVETASIEIGPAILLPDGTVFAIGATGATARFKPDADLATPGEWKAGPDLPKGLNGETLGAKDAPACLLPNGGVLCAVGPVNGVAKTYDGPTSFFEFDPTGDGVWSVALTSPYGDPGPAPYTLNFLLLPTGEVLVSNGAPSVQVFEPDGAPDPAWAPTIETCPDLLTPGGDCLLQGMQLNGLSQACSYGDDAAMATNYPIVRLRAPFPSDTVVYCRTHDHSTMAVATGRSVECTQFTVPEGVKPGVWFLEVVANGIASLERPVTVVGDCGSSLPACRSPGQADGGKRSTFAEAELFWRDLSEVHLLIDFISGRGDKSLAGLKDVCDYDAEGNLTKGMEPQRVVTEICKITYPPQGSPEANAEQAAFMLVVKDRLNYLAAPARGLTVAFTSMFAGLQLDAQKPSGPWLARWWDRFEGLFKKSPVPAVPVQDSPPRPPTFFSARESFPHLEPQARRFRRFYDSLPYQATLLLILIVLMNWDVSVTTSTLQKIDSADQNYSSLFSSGKTFLPTIANCQTDPHTPLPINEQIACYAARAARADQVASRANLQVAVERNLYTPIGWGARLFGPPRPHSSLAVRTVNPTTPPTVAATEGVLPASAVETTTLALVGGFNTIIIPAAFGWLGTLAGLMRSITAKMRDSILAPRDRWVSKVAIILGVSAGLAVGLFLKTPNVGGSTISVSAAGLAFLAGFGAEAFFTFLDGLIARLFAANQAGTTTLARP